MGVCIVLVCVDVGVVVDGCDDVVGWEGGVCVVVGVWEGVRRKDVDSRMMGGKGMMMEKNRILKRI